MPQLDPPVTELMARADEAQGIGPAGGLTLSQYFKH